MVEAGTVLGKDSKEKRVLRFLESIINKERLKANVKFYDERGLRLAAYTIELPFSNNIMFSRGLLRVLTEEESKAIGLHELAHVKYEHSGKKAIGILKPGLLLILIAIASWLIARSLGWSIPSILSEALGIVYIVFLFLCVRHFGSKAAQQTELQADSYAKRILGQSEVVINALKKTMKYQWQQEKARIIWRIWAAVLPVHPSMKYREKNLREDLVEAP